MTTVRDLINMLSRCDQDSPVMMLAEEGGLDPVTALQEVRVVAITTVREGAGRFNERPDGQPAILLIGERME